jgi:hypothetical protein
VTQTWWESWSDGLCHYAGVEPGGVIVGSTAGTGMTDNATTATDAELLAGALHDVIRRHHGQAVLDDLLAAVRARSG